MGNKIVVIGSSNVDLIMKMDHLPRVGETVTDADFIQVYGGKGANQAVGAARAGGDVVFVNCVGDDAYTPQMVKNYQEDGIDTTYVFHEKNISSGHALVMIGDAGNNYLSVAPGANYSLTPEKIDQAISVFDDAAVIVLQYEIPAETLKYIIDKAKERGIKVVFNLAPAREFDEAYINKTDILVANEVEAEFLSGIKIINKSSAEMASDFLIKKGIEMVIITLGEGGSLAVTKDGSTFVPSFKVDAVDTTSAGDVFCGSFAVAMTEGQCLEDSLRFANAAAALCVTKMGAQPSAPTREAIEGFLAEN